MLDTLKQWEEKAAQQYQEDGNADGWDSDSQPETAEQKYMRVSQPCSLIRPKCPFVSWVVSPTGYPERGLFVYFLEHGMAI